MVRGERLVDGVVSTTVVGRSIALAEVVGLNLSIVATNPFPIDLIEIIGLEDGAGDDALAGGGHADDVDSAEEDVLAGTNGRSVALLQDLEVSTLVIILDCGTVGRLESITGTLSEVAGNGTAESRVSRAG